VQQDNIQNDAFWYVRPPGVGGIAALQRELHVRQFHELLVGRHHVQRCDGLFGSSGCFFGAIASRSSASPSASAASGRSRTTASWTICAWASGRGRALAVDTNWDVTAVPEPGSFALLAVGFGALGLAARRRRRAERHAAHPKRPTAPDAFAASGAVTFIARRVTLR
jgi:hypothetical protein